MSSSPETAREPSPVRAADAEVLSGKPGAIRLLLDSSHTDGALSTQRVILRDGADGAAPHHHKRSTELFFALAGQAQLLAGETIVTLAESDTIAIPPHLTHAFAAAPGHDADLLIVIAPGVERFEYFRQLGRIITGELPADSLLAEQERYDTYFEQSSVWAALSAAAAG
jgi:mannose-6-phosphate isomerase-like protein (cupin superfamily)